MEGVVAMLGCVDGFIVMLLSSVGGMVMCCAVDQRSKDVAFSHQFGWWCILYAPLHCGVLVSNGPGMDRPPSALGTACTI